METYEPFKVHSNENKKTDRRGARIIGLILAAAVLAGIAVWIRFLNQTEKVKALQQEALHQIRDVNPISGKEQAPPQKKIYTWTDKNGVKHFSDTQPSADRENVRETYVPADEPEQRKPVTAVIKEKL